MKQPPGMFRKQKDNIMNWISWVLPVLIALPLVGGVIAGKLTSDRARFTLVTVLAALIAGKRNTNAESIDQHPNHCDRKCQKQSGIVAYSLSLQWAFYLYGCGAR